ncbi:MULTISPECIES: curli-like amyloid fiber formation chaperone CsgH [Rhizobium]|uniref:CsgH-like domain-containing protein n=1 Tax=Rhizobium tropici TaxID=398 RepID=A0A329YIP3_RHITR|nr:MULTISPECIES: curli-like amyloid fiber formation chaperone CsgH [Rhizobium]MBB3290206.1 hypothetical protein [Rhizobium sp. BK252]MBB3404907.1 hypothetical protein [Rhizobium sp. BK289]MBB3417453.1 hypothetical protein [Rhizobium sp. BK284]MBB3485163.1 hypothetical protein [Rhizobium sp. BK347]MDK4721001.1 curli-like amyloid fiber formation chaperone CsgH [Rhizobium sp. CNPSo 3968]
MVNSGRGFPITAAMMLAGLIAAGASAAVLDTDSSGSAPIRCEIREKIQGDTIFLEPLVHSDREMSGTYSISVSGGGEGGSSNIQQGGEFSAVAGRTTSLGRISVSAGGALYDVKLKVTVPGGNVSCTKQVAGVF